MAGMRSVQYSNVHNHQKNIFKFPPKSLIFRTTLNKKPSSFKYDFLKTARKKKTQR